MNIWILQTGELLPLSPQVRRMRSGLLAAELARRGHAVTWWTSAFDHFSKSWITRTDSTRILPCGVTLMLLAGLGYRKNVSLQRFIDHAIVARKFARMARAVQKPDVIVAALPEHRIAYEGYLIAREFGIPFIVDLRDRWPWDFLPLLPAPVRWLTRLALMQDFRMAQTIIREADGLTTIMESWIDWTRRDIGRPPNRKDRVDYLGAEKPCTAGVLENPTVQHIVRDWQSRWIVLFIGAFTNRSAPIVIIEAARKIRQSHPHIAPQIAFVLAGAGEYTAAISRAAASLDDVALPGHIDDPEIGALLAVSKVGIVTANSEFHGVPNKVFTYLSGGLPLISAVKGELATLIEQERIGLPYSDADSLAKAIVRLYEDDQLRRSMAERAATLFERRFQSIAIYGALADFVESRACAEKNAHRSDSRATE